MPRDWTPEARKAFGERMKAAAAARKASVPVEVADTTALNPIATDVVAPTPVRAHLKAKPKPPEPELEKGKPFAAATLISRLQAIPLDAITYTDCGLLLNALSVASTSVANARRQRQEQLEAGSHRAHCTTCDRPIDISKAGGFQILTERDQFHMPINRYYCSQNCLLARNMPSHAKQTPKEKRENRA